MTFSICARVSHAQKKKNKLTCWSTAGSVLATSGKRCCNNKLANNIWYLEVAINKGVTLQPDLLGVLCFTDAYNEIQVFAFKSSERFQKLEHIVVIKLIVRSHVIDKNAAEGGLLHKHSKHMSRVRNK